MGGGEIDHTSTRVRCSGTGKSLKTLWVPPPPQKNDPDFTPRFFLGRQRFQSLSPRFCRANSDLSLAPPDFNIPVMRYKKRSFSWVGQTGGLAGRPGGGGPVGAHLRPIWGPSKIKQKQTRS